MGPSFKSGNANTARTKRPQSRKTPDEPSECSAHLYLVIQPIEYTFEPFLQLSDAYVYTFAF